MHKAVSENRGIWGTPFTQLEDQGYADDICLLIHNYVDMSANLSAVVREVRNADLTINVAKTKPMRINTNNQTLSQKETGTLKVVEEFTCLGSIIDTKN